MTILRPYQVDVQARVFDEWRADRRVVVPVLATGAGKTAIMGDTVKRMDRPTAMTAHRSELVGQMAAALAREGVRHSIIGPRDLVRDAIAQQVDEYGRSFVDPNAQVRVVGIDTLVKMPAGDPMFARTQLFAGDEGHHFLRENKWGKGYSMFASKPLAMLPTATPNRADGCGLGVHASGIAHALVEGPSMRALMAMGYLTPYKLIAAEVAVDLALAKVGATGDWTPESVRKAVHESGTLVGDVVEEYLRRAPGKRGVTFAVDIESATEIAAEYNRRGVPAAVVTGKTPGPLRRHLIRQLRTGELLQLVNVDLFGEGFDLPAVEVVSMARPTLSFPLFAQQFGRALRVMVERALAERWSSFTDAERVAFIGMSAKPYAIIIDHVGNWLHHGLPDRPRVWSLDNREKRAKSNAGPDALRRCLNPECMAPYERIYSECPHCGTPKPPPAERGSIEAVEGNLIELDDAVLAMLRGEVARVDGPPPNLSRLGRGAEVGALNRHNARTHAQRALRYAMASWAAVFSTDPDAVNYRRFFHTFGVDVLTAQTLNASDAEKLRARIETELGRLGYFIPYTEVDA